MGFEVISLKTLSAVPAPTEVFPLVQSASHYVESLFTTSNRAALPFHNFKLASAVAQEVHELGLSENLMVEQREVVLLAAWFLYAGWSQGLTSQAPQMSEQHVIKFFKLQAVAPAIQDDVLSLVRQVHTGGEPQGLAEAILRDATNAIWARKKHRKHCKHLRQELEDGGAQRFSDSEWANYLIGLMSTTRFFTASGRRIYTEKLETHLRDVTAELKLQIEKESDLKANRTLERGIDTFFRTQSRYFFNLVALADRKSQMIIGVNSISLSILISTVHDLMRGQQNLWVPVICFVVANMVSMIFAVLAIAPNTPRRRQIKREDVLHRHGQLMSQVLFSDIDYDNFKLGVKQMMSDEAYLYDTMIRNMFDTGRVLLRKFQYLKYAYRTFIAGLTVSAVSLLIIMALASRH